MMLEYNGSAATPAKTLSSYVCLFCCFLHLEYLDESLSPHYTSLQMGDRLSMARKDGLLKH